MIPQIQRLRQLLERLQEALEHDVLDAALALLGQLASTFAEVERNSNTIDPADLQEIAIVWEHTLSLARQRKHEVGEALSKRTRSRQAVARYEDPR